MVRERAGERERERKKEREAEREGERARERQRQREYHVKPSWCGRSLSLNINFTLAVGIWALRAPTGARV